MSSWRSWHRPLVLFAGAMAVMTVVSAVGLILDDRVLAGAAIWFKPFKFAVSFVVYALALAWMLTLVTRGGGSAGGPGHWSRCPASPRWRSSPVR